MSELELANLLTRLNDYHHPSLAFSITTQTLVNPPTPAPPPTRTDS